MTGRVLIVCRNYWPEKVKINDLCEYLAGRDIKTDVLCGQPSKVNGEFFPGYDSFKVRREVHDKINIFRTIDVKRGADSNIRIFLNYVTFPIFSTFQIKQLKTREYSAVFIFQKNPVMMSRAGIKLGKLLNIPVYMYVADLWPESLFPVIEVRSGIFRSFLYKLSNSYYRKATKLILPTLKMKKHLADTLGLTDDALVVAPLYPEEEYESDIPDNDLLEKTAGSFNLLMIEEGKKDASFETVLKAAEKIRQAHIGDIRFTVVGNSDEIKEFRKKVNELALHDYFFFEGKKGEDETGKYIHVADCMLMVTKKDMIDEYSIPEQFINYMSACRPLIVSAGDQARDIVRTAGCGFSSEPEDGQGLFENIIRAYKLSGEERLKMGMNAREYQMENFNRDNTLSALAGIIEGQDIKGTDPEVSSIRKLSDL